MSDSSQYKINADPFVTATRYVINRLAYLTSFYAVIGTKIVELKNTRFAFSKESIVVYGDLDVEEEGPLSRIIINIYDRENNIVASEDVRFEYLIKPGRYRIAFTVNVSLRDATVKPPECEFIANPDPYVLTHPDLYTPIVYVGLNRMFDYEATYFNANTVTASVAVITSEIPYKIGMWYRYAKHYNGYIGRIRMRVAGEIGPLYLGGLTIHKDLYVPFLGGYPYFIRINHSIVGIGKGVGASPYPDVMNNVFVQTFEKANPGVYDIFASMPGESAPIGFNHLVIGFGRCMFDISTYRAEDLFMFGGSDVQTDFGTVRYTARLKMLAYIFQPYDYACIGGFDLLPYKYCGKMEYYYHDLAPTVNRILSNPLLFDKYKNHPCVQLALDIFKKGKKLAHLYVQYWVNQTVDPESHHPLAKLPFYMGRVDDVRNHSYRIYAPIYTAGLRRVKIYFKGSISVKYAVRRGRFPTLTAKGFSMYKWYWNELADIISASGGWLREVWTFKVPTMELTSYKVIDVSTTSFSIPVVYNELFPMVIDYRPYVYSISDISNVLIADWGDEPFCYDIGYDYVTCYYNCVKDVLAQYIYHKYRPYDEYLVVTLEDDEGNAYIPHVNGAVVFKRPDLYKDEILSLAPNEEVRRVVATMPDYYWLEISVFHTGKFIDRTEANVPYLVANQAYDFVNRLSTTS